ncbi:pathogenesis-related protein 1-like [Rosa rugosa]|uniref:pathogenesis-related protein 1-like n=1 Tax=Rosa rugosa TaxID=74645 RepID=UPI002B4138B8|nr:pathogenesis-related protein 1-like [Rosa rugosa]
MEFCKISSVWISLVALSLLHSIYAQDRIIDFLNGHNFARREVGNKDLEWDPVLERYATDYAKKHIHDCQLIHTGGPYGENLASSPIEMFGLDAVSMWVYEKKNYNYETKSCVGGECGHYLQVIWNTTTHLGCAKLRCNNGGTWIGCNYNPPPQGDLPY